MNSLEFIKAYGPDLYQIYTAAGTWKSKYTHSAGYCDRIHFFKGGEIWILYDTIKNTVRAALYGPDKKFIEELAI